MKAKMPRALKKSLCGPDSAQLHGAGMCVRVWVIF